MSAEPQEPNELGYPDNLPTTLPADLLELPRWVVWRYETRDGKRTKVPYNARTKGKADTTKRATWSAFSVAVRAYRAGGYDGLGFVLGDGIVGVDFDHCRNAETGEIEPWARSEIAALNTYTEVSPSGTGVHLLLRATLPPGTRKRGQREVYEKDRFFTVTGAHLTETPRELHERTTEVAAWHAQAFVSPARESAPSAKRDEIITETSQDDAVVMQRATRARDGDRFLRLYDGDTSGYPSQSEADFALICKLRFYTGGDATQMDRLFRRSGLMRDKWDERHYGDASTYGEGTIQRALSGPFDIWQAKAPRQKRQKRQKPQARVDSPVDSVDSPQDEPRDDGTLDAKLVSYEADDDGNARSVLLLYPDMFLYNPAFGWLMWRDTHWQRVPEGVVGQVIVQALTRRRIAGVRANSSKGEAIIKVCKADGRRVQGALQLLQIHVIEPNVDVFDADPDLLNCQNGVLHLRTGEVTPHHRTQRFTYCVPADYDPDADMSAWTTFIEGVTESANVAAYLQLCAGYSLTGHTRDEKMFYLYGPPRAGKGTFTETMLALMPDPLSSEVDFVSFTARRESDNQNFDLAELKPARVVFASESNRFQSLNPAKIKQVTGGNRIRCAFKHKDMFSYKPQFKVWLVSNHQVNADADDDALWGRVQVMVFPHSHLGSEDLTLKTTLRANLAGVLRWAVEGAMLWYEMGRLTPPQEVIEATREHRSTQDYVAQWLAESCTLGGETWTSANEVMQSYKDWCEANSIKPMRQNDVSETLVKRFKCQQKRQPKTGKRGYIGIEMGVTPDDGVTAGDGYFGEVSHASVYVENTGISRHLPSPPVQPSPHENPETKEVEATCAHPERAIRRLKTGVYACGMCGAKLGETHP